MPPGRLRRLGACLLAASVLAGAAARAETSVVVDVATGKVLAQKNASARWYPASTTKLMTAYVALRALQDKRAAMDTPVVVTRQASAEPPSKMGFPAGSVMRLDNALRMMLVKSANDLAVAVGQAIGGGSLETFVAMMNAEALRLGMRDTRFVNPNGLPGAGQYSSAKDLAILATAIRREFPAFSDLFGTEAITTGNKTIKNYNTLLGRYEGADGMKTGYICASGYNVVASATRGGRTLVAVVLGATGPVPRARIAAELLENGFRTDAATLKGPRVGELPASSGEPADVSKEICSAAGRKARAGQSEEVVDGKGGVGSPYLHEIDRPLVTVPVGLGGAAGGPNIEPGVSEIAAYGIPVPTPRPADLGAEMPAALRPGSDDRAPVPVSALPSGKTAAIPDTAAAASLADNRAAPAAHKR